MPERIRWDVRFFSLVASTNSTARELAAGGVPAGTVIVADEQTSGRGRHGRSWSSPPGAGFYGSLIVRPSLPARAVGSLTFVAAVAVAEALGELGVGGIEVKWPNDVLAHGRKVSGILTEASFAEERVDWAVVGIGVNLTADAAPPMQLVRATSLEEQGVRASSVDVLGRLLEAFDRWYAALEVSGPSAVLERWLELSPMASNTEVTVDDGRQTYAAVTAGVTEDGHLRVRRVGGDLVVLSAADVSLARR